MAKRLFIALFVWILGGVLASAQNQSTVVVPFGTTYFPFEEVRLLDSPFLTLQQKGKEYLLWLNPDSLLHFYRIEAGLAPKAAPYAGWESQDVWGAGPLRGGFLGFYLSSVSMMYQSTGDDNLLQRLKYILEELKLCQKAGKDGFLLGIKNGRELFQEVVSGKINTNNPTVNGVWAPVYLINKMLLGLSSVYTQCKLKDALPISVRLADWFGYMVLDKLTDEQIQQLLICEHGSINESYVDIYELTGEKRFLDWARRLNDRAMWVPLSEGKDILFGWHANTQIPKFTGFHKYYLHTGDRRFLLAAEQKCQKNHHDTEAHDQHFAQPVQSIAPHQWFIQYFIHHSPVKPQHLSHIQQRSQRLAGQKHRCANQHHLHQGGQQRPEQLIIPVHSPHQSETKAKDRHCETNQLPETIREHLARLRTHRLVESQLFVQGHGCIAGQDHFFSFAINHHPVCGRQEFLIFGHIDHPMMALSRFRLCKDQAQHPFTLQLPACLGQLVQLRSLRPIILPTIIS